MDVIFPSITNNPGDSRHNGTVDHFVKPTKGAPCTRSKLSGVSVPEIGAFFGSNGPLPYKPSYGKIALTGVLFLPAVIDEKTKNEITPERALNYEICECRITIDGYFIIDAPDRHNDGKKFTKPQKLTFCKSVIWQLMNDEGSLRDQIGRFGTSEISRVVREDVPEKPGDILQILPDTLGAYTPESITSYPEFRHFEDLGLTPSQRADLIELEDMDDRHDGDNFELSEYWPAVFAQVFPAPEIVQKWAMPHLRLSIIEECVPA